MEEHELNGLSNEVSETPNFLEAQIDEAQIDSDASGEGFLFPVLLFASLKDVMGKDRIAVQVTADAPTVGALTAACAEQHPQLERWLPHIKVAVNCEYVQAQHPLAPGDEIAFLPPVSGGAAR